LIRAKGEADARCAALGFRATEPRTDVAESDVRTLEKATARVRTEHEVTGGLADGARDRIDDLQPRDRNLPGADVHERAEHVEIVGTEEQRRRRHGRSADRPERGHDEGERDNPPIGHFASSLGPEDGPFPRNAEGPPSRCEDQIREAGTDAVHSMHNVARISSGVTPVLVRHELDEFQGGTNFP